MEAHILGYGNFHNTFLNQQSVFKLNNVISDEEEKENASQILNTPPSSPVKKTSSPKKIVCFTKVHSVSTSGSPLKSNSRLPRLIKPVRREIFKLDENDSASCKTDFDHLRELDSQRKQELIADRVQFCTEDIKTHLDRKISLFFAILLTTWNQNDLYFKIGHTEAQGESAKSKKTRIEGHLINIKMNAAHSSTLPCLHACERKELDAWRQSKTTQIPSVKPRYWVYLKRSGFYVNQNSTMNLPRFVNEADIVVEGGKKDKKLRKAAIKIVNEVAQGTKTPYDGLKDYLISFKTCISTGIHSNPEVLKTLKIFDNHVDETIQHLDENACYNHLLGFSFYPEHTSVLRAEVRYEMAKLNHDSHKTDSIIRAEFNTLYNKAGDFLDVAGRKRKRKRSVHGFRKYLMIHIINSYTDERIQTNLHRIFCRSLKELEDLTKEYLREKAKSDLLISKNLTPTDLDDFKLLITRWLDKKILRLRVYQVNVLKSLLKEKGLSSDQWIEEYNMFCHLQKTPQRPSFEKQEKEEIPAVITKELLDSFFKHELDLSRESASIMGYFFNINPDVFLLDYNFN